MATFKIDQPNNTSFDIKLPEIGQVFKGSGGGIFKRQGGDIIELGTGYTANTDLRDQGGNVIKAGTFLSEKDLAGKSFNPVSQNFRGSHLSATTAESAFNKQFGGNLPTFNVADFQTATQKGLLSGQTSRSGDVSQFAPTAVTPTTGGTIGVDPVTRAKEVQGEISQGVNTQATGFVNPNQQQLGGQGMGPNGQPTDALRALSIGLANGMTPDQALASIPGLSYDGDVTSGQIPTSVDAGIFNSQPPTIQDIISQQNTLRGQLAGKNDSLRQLQTQALQEQVRAQGQAIPLGLIGQQQQNVAENLAMRQIPLTNEIQALTDQLGISQEAMNLAFQMEQLSRPDTQLVTNTDADGNIVATVIDKTTGEIINQSNIGKSPVTAKARSTAVVDLGGEKVLIDTQTGERIKSYGTSNGAGGITVPRGTVLTPEDQKITLKSIIDSQKDAAAREGAYTVVQTFKNAEDMLNALDAGANTGFFSGGASGGFSLPFGLQTPSLSTLGLQGKNFTDFQSAATIFSANFIKSISGAAVSNEERMNLMKALPDPLKSEQVNRQNIQTLLSTLKNKYETQLGINFNDFPDEIPQTVNRQLDSIYKDSNN